VGLKYREVGEVVIVRKRKNSYTKATAKQGGTERAQGALS